MRSATCSIPVNADALLSIEALRTEFPTTAGRIRAVNGLDLAIRRGEIVGLVGKSGCGKTVTALSVLGLVDRPGRVVGGQIKFGDIDLLSLPRGRMAQLRGEEIAMIFQQPRGSLNPVMRIGAQIAEQFIRRRGTGRTEAWARAVALLRAVGIPAPEARARAYPHEISGGQAQRVMIAIALALEPQLLIADEPTTALDVTVQAQVLALLRERCRALDTALMLVTHDLGVVAQLADRVAVMYAGHIVEEAPVAALFANPMHPYSRGLLAAIPRPGEVRDRLVEMPGTAAGSGAPGCRFASRCAEKARVGPRRCENEPPPLVPRAEGGAVRCWAAQP